MGRVFVVKNKYHRHLSKRDFAIREWDSTTYHVYRYMNIQVTLCACKRHIPNMVKTWIRLLSWILKSM